MAEKLNVGKEITFADGKKRTIRPLTIRQLRRFMKIITTLDMASTTMDDAEIDKMVEAAKIVLEKVDPDLAKSDNDQIEDILDMRCFNELLSVAMGADPNE